MLKKRLITAGCLLPLVVVVVWFDKPLPWLTILAAIWGFMAALEFYKAVSNSKQNVSPLTILGLILILLFIISRDSQLLDILDKSFDTGLISPVLLAATAASILERNNCKNSFSYLKICRSDEIAINDFFSHTIILVCFILVK